MEQEKRWISSEAMFSLMDEIIQEGLQFSFTVTGMSMWPFLCHGRDQAIVEAVEKTDLKIGDVVLLKTMTGKYLLHRITSMDEKGFETTGDGNIFRDGRFSYDCIKARMVSCIRDGKNISCNSKSWKLCANVWMALYPCRKYIFAIWKRIRPFVRN